MVGAGGGCGCSLGRERSRPFDVDQGTLPRRPAGHRRYDLLWQNLYWIELATLEKTLFEFDPTSRMVPTTITRITANITAYSAMSCP